MRTVLQVSHFELFARAAELGESILQMIGQQRHSQQIRGRALVVQASGFRAQVLPIFERAVAATEPSQGHQIDLLILGQRPDEASQLRNNGIVGMSLASNSRALTTMKQTFSGEIESAGVTLVVAASSAGDFLPSRLRARMASSPGLFCLTYAPQRPRR